jgi:hypothetical protein
MEENTNNIPENEPAESPVYSTPAQTAPAQPKKKSSAGKIAACALALIAVAGAAFAAGTFMPKKGASSAVPIVATSAGSQEAGKDETNTKPTEKKTEPAEISPVENHGFALPGGRYTIGEDLPSGKYLFTYKTKLSDDDYWSNDYLWITYAGSEGNNETWGGDKYDDRVGDVNYEEACTGKSFYFNLHDGDVLRVDSENGEWTY